MPKILFIVSHRPGRSPSQRFRFEQYLSILKSNGYDYRFSYLLNQQDDKYFYSPGNYVRKIFIVLKSAVRRFRDVLQANQYDIIFVQREAFMTGSSFFERMFSRSRAKLIFDFDDAIWLQDVSEANKNLKWLKDTSKISRIIGYSDLIVAGNPYLSTYAKQYNEKVVIIPTTIDTDEYALRGIDRKMSDRVVIGWSGSITTIKHFEFAVPVLKKIREKYGDKVEFRVIGDARYRNESLGITGQAWNRETEVADLSAFDIGIMPIPNDDWSKGKCALKGLQYMALEIPAVMSPVGVNTEVIQDGINGFLASDETEWVEKLSRLIEDPGLRSRLGIAARKTVVDTYSVQAQTPAYFKAMERAMGSAPR